MKRFCEVLVFVIGACVGTAMTAAAAWAEDLAVIVANEFYQNHARAIETRALNPLDADFHAAGFAVLRLPNTGSQLANAEAENLLQRMRKARRLVVVLSGHVVRANGEGWLLHSDAGSANGFTIGREALPLRVFLNLAAEKPGDAVLAIADAGGEVTLGAGVRAGYQPRGIGQGVTVFTGGPQQIAEFISNNLLVPGRNLSLAVQNAPDGFRALGYVPRTRAFIEAGPAGADPAALEQAAWDGARSANTVAAYQAFLQRFPVGQFAGQAQQRLNALQLTPQDRARIAEQGLNLSRDQRRSIQRNLTLLGYDTFGVDGIFGDRSRSAIARWQGDIGVLRSGYLNANQISRIEAAAATRAEQLQREAEQRRAEQERHDRQYWQQTGALGTEDGYHAYLQRYPDGLFAGEANEALQAVEREQRRLAQQAEREAWDRAVMTGTLNSYYAYLEQYPQGRFVQEARARVQRLENPETHSTVVHAAKLEENRMSLNGVTRKLIELQLQRANLDTGPVDGKFTRQTRAALRQFQRNNSLVVTGYVTKETVVLLLANAVSR